jgi:hypothetical protein
MNKESAQGARSYQEVCVWCNTIIRHLDTKNSHGMCLKCYARMLSEHQRSYNQLPRASRHSER